jgi:tRNA (mo5U34)-methyltransferase
VELDVDLDTARRRIEEVSWYHEFDFGNGLKTKASGDEAAGHRQLWEFIRTNLAGVEFRGKSVLDIGCWDGYWSFEAERRGAASVLATDDVSRNWADGTGVYLARELLGSGISVDLKMPVYELQRLGRTFDVILFLGVYYHLHAPFHAFAQIRHCCHPGTVVVVDGPITHGLPEGAAYYNFPDCTSEWLPTLGALRMIAEGTYFDVRSQTLLAPPEAALRPPADDVLGWRYRLGLCKDALSGRRQPILDRAAVIAPPQPSPREAVNRVFMTLTPREGESPMFAYAPPYGLAAFDPRFRTG